MTDKRCMPRVKRRQGPGVFTHVIVRFVDGQYIMDEVDGARERYLLMLDRALCKSDWILCFHALMGTHVHLGLVGGEQPLETWARAVHSGWANWINAAGRRRGGRSRGPVLADRPTALFVPDHRVAVLGAYLHNNPVRAGVVTAPQDSPWTSHRAYLGMESSIPSLDVARGLSFYGCTPTREGRRRFHEFVDERRREPRNPELSGVTAREVRRRAREVHGSGAELMTPVVSAGDRASYPLHLSAPKSGIRFTGSAEEFLKAVAPVLGVGPRSLCGPGRSAERARARRSVILAWRLLGRRSHELSAVLQVSQPAASNAVARAHESDFRHAQRLLAGLLEDGCEVVKSVPSTAGGQS